MKLAERILCWNSRGASNQDFLWEIREMMRHHQPKILILLEPKISGQIATDVCRALRKTHWVRSESEGFSGGIWVLWDEEDIQVRPLYLHSQFNHLVVCSDNQQCWELTAIYASPHANLRRQLWSALDQLVVEEAWVMIGDFNSVLKGEERSTGVGVSSAIVDWVDRQGLIDLVLSAPLHLELWYYYSDTASG